MSNQYAFDEAASKWIAASIANPTYITSPSNRNVLINGAFAIDQRNTGASQTFTAAAALAYSVDRWYGYCTGANITGARVAGAAPSQYYYRFTGAASNTAIGFGQRIEAANSFYLAGQTATLSVSLASTSLTSITWSAFYANTADTFGTLASPTRTSIATGTFTITSTLTNYSANITIPSAATTGIEILFTTGALLATQTLTFAQAQLELGSVATPFERRPIGMELALCQRYYYRSTLAANKSFGTGQVFTSTTAHILVKFPQTMRSVYTLPLESTGVAADYQSYNAGSFNVICNGAPIEQTAQSTVDYGTVRFSFASGMVAGNVAIGQAATSGAFLGFSAEL